jgi:hypothetical protein
MFNSVIHINHQDSFCPINCTEVQKVYKIKYQIIKHHHSYCLSEHGVLLCYGSQCLFSWGVLSPGVKRGRGVTLTTHSIQCRGREWVGAMYPLPLRLHIWVVGLLYLFSVSFSNLGDWGVRRKQGGTLRKAYQLLLPSNNSLVRLTARCIPSSDK